MHESPTKIVIISYKTLKITNDTNQIMVFVFHAVNTPVYAVLNGTCAHEGYHPAPQNQAHVLPFVWHHFIEK